MIETPITRVIVVDDEPLGRRRLVQLINQDPTLELVAECGDGEEAINAITTLKPDLVFLDVQMPEINAFDVIEAVGPANMPGVVFVTAFDDFALQAFDASALDYLLKPFDDARFQKAVERARASVIGRQVLALQSVVGVATQRAPERFVVRTGSRCDIVQAKDVNWFEAADNYVKLHMADTVRTMRGSISSLEQRLDPAKFMRIHRSTIVNVDRIKRVEPHNQTEFAITLACGARLTSSRSYRQNVRAFLERI